MRSGASGAVRRCVSRRVFCRFCHARSRVPMVFGPFHYGAFCERAAPDAPETIDDQRRCTGCRDRTIYGGSRGSASLPMLPVAPVDDQGAAPDVVIGQSTAARAGAHPYRAGEVARSYHSDSVYQRFSSNRNKGLRVGSFLVRTFLGQEWRISTNDQVLERTTHAKFWPIHGWLSP